MAVASCQLISMLNFGVMLDVKANAIAARSVDYLLEM